MTNDNNGIIPSFKETIFNDRLIDLIQDYEELSIDAVMKDGILKEIPIVNTCVAFRKTFIAIRDRHFVKKTLVFMQKFQNGELSKEDIVKHRKELEHDQKKLESEMETIIVYIDRQVECLKCKILANFYLAYIDELQDFDWDDFCIFAEALDKISVYDLEELKDVCMKERIGIDDEYDGLALSRLSSQHLVEYFNGMGVHSVDSDYKGAIIANSTRMGKMFNDIGLKGIGEDIF